MHKVSVIIPTFDRERFIVRALESVLAQTIPAFEIIVIDDGSRDRTREVLGPYMGRITYLHQTNQGISAARNAGLRRASADMVAFLDSDDTWAPEKLAMSLRLFEERPALGLAHHAMQVLDEEGRVVGTKPSRPCGVNFEALVAVMSDLPTSSVVVRRDCFEEAGFFDENLPMMEDYEMWLRIACRFEVGEVVSSQPLAFYHRHGAQVTRDRRKVYESLVLFDEKIALLYPEVAKHQRHRRLAHNCYMLSRINHEDRKHDEASRLVFRAVRLDPLVGAGMSSGGIVSKFLALIKSGIYLCLCAFRSWGAGR